MNNIYKTLCAISCLGMAGSVFAANTQNQNISITNNLQYSGQNLQIELLAAAIQSGGSSILKPGNRVVCTLDNGSQDLCGNLAAGGDDGVAIPYGHTLTVQVAPVGTIPGAFEWNLAFYTNMQAQCGFETQTFINNPTGVLTPADIQQTISIASFEGGTSYCKHVVH